MSAYLVSLCLRAFAPLCLPEQLLEIVNTQHHIFIVHLSVGLPYFRAGSQKSYDTNYADNKYVTTQEIKINFLIESFFVVIIMKIYRRFKRYKNT